MKQFTQAAAIAALSLMGGIANAQALGTSFTYQGLLEESGVPANGLYDILVCAYPTPSGTGMALACAPDFVDVPVEKGLFTLAVDFGPMLFNGQPRYLETSVRPGDSIGAYTALSPRQLIRAVPESLRARMAAAAPWSGLTGVPTDLADGDQNSGGTVTGVTAGNGLTGGTITSSGTLAIDTAVVQARITATCAVGSYLRGIAVDGAPLCEEIAVSNGRLVLDGNVEGVPLNARYVDVALNPNGLPTFAYQKATRDAAYAACESRTCLDSVLVGRFAEGDAMQPLGRSVQVAFGSDGRPWFAYGADGVGSVRFTRCNTDTCEGAPFNTVVDPAGSAVVEHLSLVRGSDDLPIISLFDPASGSLRVVHCADTACAVATSVPLEDPMVGTAGEHNQLVVPGDGLPIIVYQNNASTAYLRAAKCVNVACTAVTYSTIDNPVNAVGASVAVTVANDGFPVMSYRDDTAQALKYARCLNAACTGMTSSRTIDDDASANFATDTSIAIGADGLPIIAYTAASNGIKVAKCRDLFCNSVDITKIIRDGAEPAITVPPDGLPVIGYTVASRTLAVYKCGSPSCK